MVSCGEYHPADGTSGGSNRPPQSSESSSGGDDENKENPSTVKMYYYVNGKRTLYKNPENISAIWRGENSLHHAEFDENGTATVYGLDGNYQVTLSGIPEGYTYNPNAAAHKTTNYDRDIEIDLYDVIVPKSKGTDMYNDYILLSDETKNAVNPYVYRVTLESETSRVHCQFSPPSSGLYSVESWVDVQEQKINPSIDVYNGSFAFKTYSHTLEDGGASDGYISNFKHEVDITTDEIGNDFSFAVFAGVKNNKYPVTIDFVVQCDGEPIRQRIPAKMMVPTETLYQQPNYSKNDYKIVTADVEGSGGRRLFDGTMYKWNEETGFYHVYDVDKYKGYTETYADGTSQMFADGYGPILYAEVVPNEDVDGEDGLNPFLPPYTPPGSTIGIPISFSNVESVGNSNLTLSSATENYKLFIEGWDALVSVGYAWIDTLSADEVKKYSQVKGYATYVNNDCYYGVTEELKDFIQKYSTTQELFADGEGRAEDNGYDALEQDQWLFACKYYVKK